MVINIEVLFVCPGLLALGGGMEGSKVDSKKQMAFNQGSRGSEEAGEEDMEELSLDPPTTTTKWVSVL